MDATDRAIENKPNAQGQSFTMTGLKAVHVMEVFGNIFIFLAVLSVALPFIGIVVAQVQYGFDPFGATAWIFWGIGIGLAISFSWLAAITKAIAAIIHLLRAQLS